MELAHIDKRYYVVFIASRRYYIRIIFVDFSARTRVLRHKRDAFYERKTITIMSGDGNSVRMIDVFLFWSRTLVAKSIANASLGDLFRFSFRHFIGFYRNVRAYTLHEECTNNRGP